MVVVWMCLIFTSNVLFSCLIAKRYKKFFGFSLFLFLFLFFYFSVHKFLNFLI